MSGAHIAGIKALLTATPYPLTVYITDVEGNPDFPYILISAPTLNALATTLDDVPRDISDYIQVKGVGVDDESCRFVLDKAFARLDRKHPVVAGFSTDLHRRHTGVLAPDRQVILTEGGHPIYATDTYHYQATPS